MKKKNLYSILVMIFATMALSSCATLLSKKQTVTVTSDVEGAQVYKGTEYVGTTPLTFQTKSAKSTFTLIKDGYEPQTVYTDVDIRWNTMWNWFNCWIGWFVDLGVGSTQKYGQTNYYVPLKKIEYNQGGQNNDTEKEAKDILKRIRSKKNK